jgi:hypothetical protein
MMKNMPGMMNDKKLQAKAAANSKTKPMSSMKMERISYKP